MNGIETQNFSNSVHVDDATSNEANVEEISEREMRLCLLRYLSAGPSEREMHEYLARYLYAGSS